MRTVAPLSSSILRDRDTAPSRDASPGNETGDEPHECPGIAVTGTSSAARLRLLLDLRLVEVANALGLGLTLPTLRLIAVAVPPLGAAVAFLGGVVVASIGADILGAAGVPYALSTLVLFMVYSGMVALLGEMVSRFRYSVSGHPNRAFFRALDVSARLVFLIYVGPRILGHALLWTMVGTGTAVGLAVSGSITLAPVPGPLLWSALICTPAGMGMIAVAAGLLAATRSPAAPPRTAGVAVLAVVAGALVGLSATTWLVLPLVRGSLPLPFGDGAVLLSIAGTGAPILLLSSSALAGGVWRRMRTRSFRTVPSWSPRYALLHRRTMLLTWVHLLSAQRIIGWRHRVEVRIMGGLVGIASAVAAARLVGLPTPPETLAETVLLPTVGFISVIVGLTVSDLVVGDLGSHAYGAHLRSAVEGGVPLRTAVSAQAVALALPVLFLSALLGLVMSLILGAPVLTPLLVGLGSLTASVIALHVLPPPRGADGTATESLFTGLAMLFLAALPVAVPLTFPATHPWFAPVGVALLVGGAVVCLRQRLIAHP